ncbi:MAG: hypothetical protein ACHQII_06280, partial [Bacteroidia bacterium]
MQHTPESAVPENTQVSQDFAAITDNLRAWWLEAVKKLEPLTTSVQAEFNRLTGETQTTTVAA